MDPIDRFMRDHTRLTRRYFVGLGAASLATLAGRLPSTRAGDHPAELKDAVAKLESFMTPLDKFRDVSRGSPVPHSLSDEKRTQVGFNP